MRSGANGSAVERLVGVREDDDLRIARRDRVQIAQTWSWW